MKRRAALAIATASVLLLFGVPPAAAGGWAVSTLDEVPSPHAGDEIAVGFTVRQHGVTPVDDLGGRSVGIEVVGTDGTSRFFAATHDGAPGHFVASVTFPDAGEYTWSVRQGWFAPQDLGPVTVTEAARSTGSGSAGSSAPWLSVALLVAAAALAAGFVGDHLAGRRRAAPA